MLDQANCCFVPTACAKEECISPFVAKLGKFTLCKLPSTSTAVPFDYSVVPLPLLIKNEGMSVQRLVGKVVIVSGAAGGIGLGCAAVAARQGARVVIADINDDEGEAAAEQIGATYFSAGAV